MQISLHVYSMYSKLPCFNVIEMFTICRTQLLQINVLKKIFAKPELVAFKISKSNNWPEPPVALTVTLRWYRYWLVYWVVYTLLFLVKKVIPLGIQCEQELLMELLGPFKNGLLLEHSALYGCPMTLRYYNFSVGGWPWPGRQRCLLGLKTVRPRNWS